MARPRPLREIALVGVLFLGYKLGRAAAAGRVGLAHHNADRVWGFERWLHLPAEKSLQDMLLQSDTVIRAVNAFYAYVHFPAAAVFLVWLYLRRPADYLLGRRMLAAVTAAALIVHVTFPLAPPRLTSDLGMVDTAAWLGPAVYGTPATDKISNQFAAMPSLHVGWALVVALVLIQGSRSRWRYAWLGYPITTTLVVVGTANHYWLDAIAAVALVAVAFRICNRLPARGRPAPRLTVAELAARLPAVALIALPMTLPRRTASPAADGGSRSNPVPQPRTEDQAHPA